MSSGVGQFVRALSLSQLPPGSMSPVELAGRRIILANIGGEVYAVSGVCTHEETDLGTGFMLEERVICPLHLSQFDLRTGEVLNPPATVPLTKFNVKIDGDGIFVEV